LIISGSKYFLAQLKLAIWVIFPLVFAGGIYIFFRSHHTVVNVILANFIDIPVLQSKNYWIVFCLPGGLWLFSFQMAILFFVYQYKYIAWFVSLVCALGIEGLQFLHITDGFFDWLDIYTYLIFSVLSLLSYKLKKHFTSFNTPINNSFKYFIFAFFCGIVFLSDLF
jgi:hypothetical protein